MTPREIVQGWDFKLALGLSAVVWFLLPDWPSNALAQTLYEMGISVLSIVFAVFFTALTVLISSGDEEFVRFLRKLKIYEGIVATFRFTLINLFIALMYAVLAFAWTASIIDMKYTNQTKYLLVAYSFLFLYSLFAVIYSTHDAMEYAARRVQFMDMKQREREATPSIDPAPSKASEPDQQP